MKRRNNILERLFIKAKLRRPKEWVKKLESDLNPASMMSKTPIEINGPETETELLSNMRYLLTYYRDPVEKRILHIRLTPDSHSILDPRWRHMIVK